MTTYHTDLSGHQVTQSVEPVDVGLQVTGFTLPKETLEKRKEKHDQIVFWIFMKTWIWIIIVL